MRGGAREGAEDAVTLALLDGTDPALPGDGLVQDLVVPGDGLRHRFGRGLPRAGGALDVGEQERYMRHMA